jgi:hypothetical protein
MVVKVAKVRVTVIKFTKALALTHCLTKAAAAAVVAAAKASAENKVAEVTAVRVL